MFENVNWAQVLVKGAMAIGGLATFTVGLLYALQEKIIYIPVIPGVPKAYVAFPPDYGMDFEDIWIKCQDGIKLHAWMMWRKGLDHDTVQNLPLVIFFQENAGNMSMRLHFCRTLVSVLNCKVFILSYRGYGESQGSPSEAGIQMDVQSTMKYLMARKDFESSKTVIMGRSLGGAVAIYTAVEFKRHVSAVIVENTFTSIMDMAPQALPPLRPFVGHGKPCNWLIRNKWDSINRVKDLKDTPMLFLVSLADEIVHPMQMATLFKAHGRDPWSLHEFEDAAHMDCYHTHAPLYWPKVKSFFDSVVGK